MALRAAPELPVEHAPLPVTVRNAIAAMTWLQDSDQALVAIAMKYAHTLEGAEDAKTVGWIGPHFINALRALGGTPAERRALGVEEQVKGRLAQLRAAR